jgi:hypothetical protein
MAPRLCLYKLKSRPAFGTMLVEEVGFAAS